MSFPQLQICFGPFRLSIRIESCSKKQKLVHRMTLLNIHPPVIVPCAGAYFKPKIDHYIFCPSCAKKFPSPCVGKPTTSTPPVTCKWGNYRKRIQDLSSCHEKNNGYLGPGQVSIVPQLWQEVRPHFDTYDSRCVLSSSVPCEWSIIWCGSGSKHDAGIMYFEYQWYHINVTVMLWVRSLSYRGCENRKSCWRTVARMVCNHSSWLNWQSPLIQAKYDWPTDCCW
jgi:hypothetical protein